MNNYFRTRVISPIISLIMARFEHGEIIGCTEKVSETVLIDSLSVIYHQMTPQIYVVEQLDGNWELLTAIDFVSALYQFISGDVVYPSTGPIEEFKGKTFAQLTRNAQRQITETKLKLSLFEISRADDGKEAAYRDMVKIASKLA